MELTREECMLCTRVRHAFAMTARAGATKTASSSATASTCSPTPGLRLARALHRGGGRFQGLLRLPARHIPFFSQDLLQQYPRRRGLRGYGSPQTAYAIECLMDDTAARSAWTRWISA